jgi:hypothetical protein
MRQVDEVIAELVAARGWYAAAESRSHRDTSPITDDPEEAMRFGSPDDAESWLAFVAPHQQFELRFLAAVRAEADQRDARVHDNGM